MSLKLLLNWASMLVIFSLFFLVYSQNHNHKEIKTDSLNTDSLYNELMQRQVKQTDNTYEQNIDDFMFSIQAIDKFLEKKDSIINK